MSLIAQQAICELFNDLNTSKIAYLLIRNIDNEISSNLNQGKDIDLLFKPSDKHLLKSFLASIGYKQIRHPHWNSEYLYGVDKFQFYKNKKNGILIDAQFQLSCRSLDAGQWIPLDQVIQQSAWDNSITVSTTNIEYNTLSPVDELVTLIARAIFDKKCFPQSYINRITTLLHDLQHSQITHKLSLIFFQYTNSLLQQLDKGDFDKIILNYYQFKDY